MWRVTAPAAALWLACAGGAAAFELESGEPLRLIGEVEAPPEGAPKRFVIDALVTEGDEPFQSRIEGWFAGLEPSDAGMGGIGGTCVGERCALSVGLEAGEFGIIGDLVAPATPARGQAALKPHFEAKALSATAVAFTPFGDEAPGLGVLAPRGAIGAHALSDQLAWLGVDLGFSNLDDAEPDERERAGLAQWQAGAARPPSGLLTTQDLADLAAAAAAAKAAAGWTAVGGAGWTAGYPAALLSPAGERRFVSADGKAELAYGVEPPMDDEAWDSLVERETEDKEGHESRSYTRINDDLSIAVTRNGVRHVRVWARRKGGVARLAFVYPDGDEARARFEPILLRTFRVGDDLKAP